MRWSGFENLTVAVSKVKFLLDNPAPGGMDRLRTVLCEMERELTEVKVAMVTSQQGQSCYICFAWGGDRMLIA